MMVSHSHLFRHVIIHTYGLVIVILIILYDIVSILIKIIHRRQLIGQEILLAIEQEPQLSYPIL